jgi:hypothetical protein
MTDDEEDAALVGEPAASGLVARLSRFAAAVKSSAYGLVASLSWFAASVKSSASGLFARLSRFAASVKSYSWWSDRPKLSGEPEAGWIEEVVIRRLVRIYR